MARASLNPDRAKQGGGGIEAGNYEVLAAKFQNHQTDFRSKQLTLVAELATLDKDGDPVRGADPVDLFLSYGAKSLEAFQPGKGKNVDDADPEGLGTDADVEGNTIFCSGSEQFNANCGAMVFLTSLTKVGFPKDLLDKCWAPAFVGLKFALETLDPKTCNDKFGMRLNTRPMRDEKTGEERPVTYKVATKWLNPTYLNGSGSSAVASGGSSAPANAPASAEDIAAACLKKVSLQKAGPKNAIKTRESLEGFATNAFATGKFKGAAIAEVRKFLKDEAWVKDQLIDLGADLDMNDDGAWTGKVTFPAMEK